MLFKNCNQIVENGKTPTLKQIRKDILDVFSSAIASVDPYFSVKKIIQNNKIVAGSKVFNLLDFENVYLIGDAAGQVKATTGGGLVPGLKAAEVLVHSIIYNEDYKKNLNKIRRDLWVHLRIRRLLDKFSNSDCNTLLKLMNKTSVRYILRQVNRDLPYELIIKLALAEPRTIYFGIKTFIK